ncbi:MAG TPA: serine/threonine protein kinase [Leptolyngbyaceae cyanobacterium M33_DOE_097]|nr:serine/threonine protein kinase [Leptolyngbyaceae cyanobacterium M33_DOE_097]
MIRIIGDRYEVNQQLSRKAGRQTLLAFDRKTGEQVVLKLLTFSSEFEWESLKLFEREIQTLKTLSHPMVPKYLNSFELDEPDGKGFALVQTYIGAPSLESHIKSGRTFSEIEIKQIAESLLKTLIYLHGQCPPVIHRDIKPSNALLTDRSGNYVGQVYLVDFGSVQTVVSKDSGTFTVVGTYGYMPSEQFSGRTTPVSDLYSLGATLIYVATGQHPADLMTDDLQLEFGQPTLLSLEFTRWLQRMVQPVPSKRFASATEALQALKNPSSHADLALPLERPAGCRITLDKQQDQLCVQLPSAYLVSSEQLSQFLGIGVGVVGLVLFIMIFTTSAWHIVSFVAFIYLCDAVSKIHSYKILISNDKISLQSLLLKFKLKTWSYRKADIYQLAFGKQSLKGWAQVLIPVEHHQYQLVLNIGARTYIIHAQNEIEISWLADELSRWLNLPLTPLTAGETTNQVIASQFSQTLQPPTQRILDRSSSPVRKPANSKIHLVKCDGGLRIRLSYERTAELIVYVVFFVMIIPGLGLILLRLLSWIFFWLFGWMDGAELHEVGLAEKVFYKFWEDQQLNPETFRTQATAITN